MAKINIPFEWIYKISEDVSVDAPWKKKWSFDNSKGTLKATMTEGNNIVFEWEESKKSFSKHAPSSPPVDDWVSDNE